MVGGVIDSACVARLRAIPPHGKVRSIVLPRMRDSQ